MGSLYRSIEGLLARMEIDERGWIVISGPLDCVNNVIVVVAPKISHGAETRRHRNRDRSILRETANRERERERERANNTTSTRTYASSDEKPESRANLGLQILS